MSNLILPGDFYGVTEKNSVPVVSSQYVAQVFKKGHKDVLRAIQNCNCTKSLDSAILRRPTTKTSKTKSNQKSS